MKKILFIGPFFPMDKALESIKNGEEYPLHHMWCYDEFIKAGYEVDFIECDRNSFINKLGEKLNIANLHQQIEGLKKAKKYDFVFDPIMTFTFFLAFLKIIGLYNKPIIAIAHQAYMIHKKNPLKRLRQYLIRYIYFKGVDSILFFDEAVYKKSKDYSIKANDASYLKHWGVEVNFFEDYGKKQPEPPTQNYIFSTGGANRDFDTLVKAFHEINFDLKISVKEKNVFWETLHTPVTPNIIIDESTVPPYGTYSTGLIRADYYNAYAVALPLTRAYLYHYGSFGITVIMEALAMGKPVITTNNDAFPFNVEKEKVGLNVDYEDVEGWRQAINYLINNPDEAREMGERGLYLVKKKYNYKLFSEEVIQHIRKFYGNKSNVFPQNKFNPQKTLSSRNYS